MFPVVLNAEGNGPFLFDKVNKSYFLPIRIRYFCAESQHCLTLLAPSLYKEQREEVPYFYQENYR
jgi:hypothetical protein